MGHREVALSPLRVSAHVFVEPRDRSLPREIGEQFRPPALLRSMVRAGKLGKKTGEGFYRWIDGQPQGIVKSV